MKKQEGFEDDGRIVADMSGLEHTGFSVFHSMRNKQKGVEKTGKASDMSDEDRRIFIKAAIASTLVIAGVFLVACALFILFCQYVWLR